MASEERSWGWAPRPRWQNLSALGSFLRRLKARLGPEKAVTATAHRLARLVYQTPSRPVPGAGGRSPDSALPGFRRRRLCHGPRSHRRWRSDPRPAGGLGPLTGDERMIDSKAEGARISVEEFAGAAVTGRGSVGTFSMPQVAPGSTGGNFGGIAISPSGAVLVSYRSMTQETGTSSGGNTLTTLNDTTKSWTPGQWTGRAVRISSGTGAGQVQRITGNTATQLSVSSNWATVRVAPVAVFHFDRGGHCYPAATEGDIPSPGRRRGAPPDDRNGPPGTPAAHSGWTAWAKPARPPRQL
jgi:hypothetical protein